MVAEITGFEPKEMFMFESLESRTMFDTTGVFEIPVGISNFGGFVEIKGADTNDEATVSMVNQKVHVTLMRWKWTQTPGGPAPIVHQLVEKEFDPALVQKIFFYGLDGNDTFTNDTSKPCYAAGGRGDDILTGGWGADDLHGGADSDELYGRSGNDTAYGDAGSDLLVGGSGSDYLVSKDGTAGNDDVYGGNLDGTRIFGGNDVAVIDIGPWFSFTSDNVTDVESIIT
jgi:Ca2+-binding RTX toxin-like protein